MQLFSFEVALNFSLWYIYGICGAYPLVEQFAKVIPNLQVLTDQNINVFPIRTFPRVDKIQNIFCQVLTSAGILAKKSLPSALVYLANSNSRRDTVTKTWCYAVK